MFWLISRFLTLDLFDSMHRPNVHKIFLEGFLEISSSNLFSLSFFAREVSECTMGQWLPCDADHDKGKELGVGEIVLHLKRRTHYLCILRKL